MSANTTCCTCGKEGINPDKHRCIPELKAELNKLTETIDALKQENERLVKWVDDLQSGMYINCVYCGHCYGPQDKVPCSMAEALKKHIEQCPKHPMSALKQDLAACREVVEAVRVLAHDDSFNAWQQMYKIRQLLPEARAKE